MPDRFIVVGANIIENDGEILLVKEGKQVAEDTWNLPAGSMEESENPKECAVREAKEETGLEIEPEGLVGVYVDTSDDGSEKVVNFVFQSKVGEREASAADQETVKKVEWYNPEEVKEFNLRTQYIKDAVEDFRSGKIFKQDIIKDTTDIDHNEMFLDE